MDRLWESLEKVKKFIKSYLPFTPLLEEFANKVGRGDEQLQEGNSITGYCSPLGELMESFKEKFQERFYWCPIEQNIKVAQVQVRMMMVDEEREGERN